MSRACAERKTRNRSARRDQAGAEGDEDDVAADVVEAREDRHGVAPDPDDAADLPSGVDRQVLADETLGLENRRARAGDRLTRCHDIRLRLAGDGELERRVGRQSRARGGPVVGGQEHAIRQPDLDPEDLPGAVSVVSRSSRTASWAVVAPAPDSSRYRASRLALTNVRAVAASLPTTSFSVAAEKCADTIAAWKVAVIPTRARNTP